MKKVQPKSVSGRVVNTVMVSSVGSPASSQSVNFTSAPSLRPIQFACICLTRSGQPGSLSRSSSSSWA